MEEKGKRRDEENQFHKKVPLINEMVEGKVNH